eukprot:1881956-Amphidinium_carterae.1
MIYIQLLACKQVLLLQPYPMDYTHVCQGGCTSIIGSRSKSLLIRLTTPQKRHTSNISTVHGTTARKRTVIVRVLTSC